MVRNNLVAKVMYGWNLSDSVPPRTLKSMNQKYKNQIMTKQELFDYFMSVPNPDHYGHMKKEKNFKSFFPDLYSEFQNFIFTEDLLNKPFVQKLWHFLQDDHGNIGHCLFCGKRTAFRMFTTGYSKFCSNSCANKSELTKAKIRTTVNNQSPEQKILRKERQKKTCDELYGGIGFASEELKTKYETTMIEKHGEKHNFLVPEIIEQRNLTWQQKHNAGNPMKNPLIASKSVTTKKNKSPEEKAKTIRKTKQTKLEIYGDENYTNREQIEKTSVEKYGYKCPMKSDACRKKLSNTLFRKMQEKYPCILSYNKQTKLLVCKCIDENCSFCEEKIFEISYKTFQYRNRVGNELCTKSNPAYNKKERSYIETEIYEYVRYLYNDNVLRNNRKTLNGKELDIYIPSLNLAFEVDGDFWHLNPELYDEEYEYNGRTVESETNRRTEKDLLAKEHGIEIIHIWQYDWNNRKRKTKKLIRNKILEHYKYFIG